MSEQAGVYGVWTTSEKFKERAVKLSAAKKAALREADRLSAQRRGDIIQVRVLDGLGLLLQAQEITPDQHRVGLAYQRAYEACAGLRGRNCLNEQPPGDRDLALQATVDAGRFVAKCEAFCTTTLELESLRKIVGQGLTIRSQVSGRKHREMTDLVVALLARMAEARL